MAVSPVGEAGGDPELNGHRSPQIREADATDRATDTLIPQMRHGSTVRYLRYQCLLWPSLELRLSVALEVNANRCSCRAKPKNVGGRIALGGHGRASGDRLHVGR